MSIIKRAFGLAKRIVRKLFYIITLCPLLKRTNWYKNFFLEYIYPDNIWYRNHEERNFDLVSLGSSGAKWAFDFEDCGIKAMNWAQQPQTLLEDYNLLRHYHSILRKGGYVIITIMPFTGLNKSTGMADAMKYLNLDYQGEPIQPYKYEEACRYAQYPVLFGKPAVKALIKYLLGKERQADRYACTKVTSNPMSASQLDEDAKRWIEGWKRQFAIDDFEAPLTLQNAAGRQVRIKVMRELVDFCTERGYVPVYVIPPVTRHLAEYYTSKFEQTYIYGYLKEVDRNVLTLDYSKDNDLMTDDLYFNSFFLNAKGRKIFTAKVLDRILANKESIRP